MLMLSTMMFPMYADDIDRDDENEEEEIEFVMDGIPNNPTMPSRPKTPIRIPHVYKCNYTLTFEGVHPEYTLYIMKDGFVEYFTEVLPSMQKVQLPILPTGDYEVYLVLGDFLFKGVISVNS